MIIVIGATGFIGMYTVRALLEKGYQVLGTGRNEIMSEKVKAMGADFVRLDITDISSFDKLPNKNVDAVILLAGLLPANEKADLKTVENAADYFEVNVIGTINVLEYCRNNGIAKVISNCSYSDVSGAWGKKFPITEDEPRCFKYSGDHAIYVISRNAANDVMEYYNQQHLMQCAWFRFPPVYGVGPHGTIYVNGKPYKSGIATFIDNAKEGTPIEIWGDPHIKRDIIYVKDVAKAYLLALQSSAVYGLYNITAHVQIDLEEQVKTCIEVFGEGKNTEIVYRPDKPNNTPSFLYSIDKAKRDLGFEPEFNNFKAMMLDYKNELESGFWNSLISTRRKE